jgi:hypothetical protein
MKLVRGSDCALRTFRCFQQEGWQSRFWLAGRYHVAYVKVYAFLKHEIQILPSKSVDLPYTIYDWEVKPNFYGFVYYVTQEGIEIYLYGTILSCNYNQI